MRLDGIVCRGMLGTLLICSMGRGVRLVGQQTGAAGTAKAASAPTSAKDSPAAANDSPAATTISVDARLVNLPVVVRDKKGALVQNLTKDNFTLQVDGHAQTIRYFNLDTDLPLTLGLLVDTSMSQRDVLDEERKASSAFLDDMLTGPADRDKAYVIEFAKQIDLLQDVTSSKPKLQAAIKQLDTSPDSGDTSGSGNTSSNGSGNGGNNGNGGGNNGGGNNGNNGGGNNGGSSRTRRGGGTTLYDALFLSSDELMSKQKGRKAVVILSDGDDRGSKESLTESIEAAQKADTIVYAIYFKGKEVGGQNDQNQNRQGGGGYPGGRGGGGIPGIGFPGGGGGQGGGGGRGGGQGRPQGGGQVSRTDGKKILQRMADETGGRLFEVSKKETVAQIYTEIGEELRAQYRLGYTPDQATASDGYHKIDLALTKSSPKDLYVQTRDGYYTGK